MTLEVGQIIYVLTPETDHIVPMQVNEELRRKNIDGEAVTYLVCYGPEKQTFKFDEIKGKVFLSLDLAIDHVKKNFEKWLEKQAIWTVDTQKTWYQTKQPTDVILP